MSIAKVIEVISEGKTIEDAIQSGIKEVSNSLKHVKQFNVDHIEALADEKGKVVTYRVRGQVTFVIDEALMHANRD